jgi:type VI secretion system protein ImpJ
MQLSFQTIPDPVQWHEGMLLAPQHFQLLSARYEFLLEQAAVGGPLPGWGVRHVLIDRTRLMAGEFRLLEAEVVMPGGFQVVLGRERELAVDLTPLAEELRSEPLYVFLAVPARRALATAGELARYHSAESGPVRDETGESEITIPVLRPNLELAVGASLPARLEGVPVARVRHRDEAYVLDEYEPPSPALPDGCSLRQQCAEVVSQVREKALLVAERIHGGSLAGEGIELWQARLQVRSLAAALPGLEALLGLDRVHPQVLYVKMCDLAGQLAALSHGLIPPLFRPYDHMDPAACLLPLVRFACQALAEGVSENWHRIRLVWEDGEFRARPDPWLNAALASAEPRIVLGLRGPAGAGAGEAMVRWCEEALIASVSVREQLIDARALGVPRSAVNRVEGLTQAAGMTLFTLDISPEFMRPNEPVVIQGSPAIAPPPVEAVLYVRKVDQLPGIAGRQVQR